MHHVLLVLLVVLLTACGSSGPIHEPTKLEQINSRIGTKVLWSLTTPTSSQDKIYTALHPVLFDGVLYSVGASGVVQANKIKRGRRLWKVKLKTTISAGLGGNEELLLLGTAKGEVIALERETGEIRWRTEVASEVMAIPVIDRNYVIVRSGDGTTEALDAETGEKLWSYNSPLPPLSLRGEATPVVIDDLVLLGQANGRLAALSIYDGVVQWESTVVAAKGRTDLERMVDVDATPVVVGDVIYVVAHQGRVLALSKLTGTMLWSRDLGASVGLVTDELNVYLVDDEGQVWALDRRTGATLWKSEKLKYRRLTAPVTNVDAVVVGDYEGYLHWLSKTDGHIFTRYQVDEKGIHVAPLVLDDVLYTRSKTGKLEALKLNR